MAAVLSMGIAWYGHRKRPRRLPWETGWAIRRDWPDGGHDFLGFGWSPDGLDRRVSGDKAYWGKGPVKPVAYTYVRMSLRDFKQHGSVRLLCRAPDCPVPAVTMQPAGVER